MPHSSAQHNPVATPTTTPAFDRGAVVAALGLLAACVLQAPGRLATDTKLDLAVDPAGFLERSLHLIDLQAAFDRIPNQGAGYLFPMGPFFALGDALGLPMWLVQRLWLALLLVVALVGVRLVARRLGIGTSGTQTLAGLAYALAPAVLGPLGLLSGGLVPTALAPWALLPLLGTITSPRRAAARSGLAILCMGGINAASTGGALLIPFVWLLTRRRGPTRTRLIAWWVLAAALATLWWTTALALQTRYGLRFTSYTESATVTTSSASLTETLRGTSYWLGYLVRRDAWLPGALDLIRSPLAIAGTVLVAAGGLAGLSRRDLPERRFLTIAAVAGTVCIGIGYGGSISGPFSDPVRELLDGALSPFRNVIKFDPLLRLPLALGFAHVVVVVGRTLRERRLVRPGLGVAVAAGTLMVLAAGSVPIVRGHVTTPGSFERIPRYWDETAGWLGRHGAESRAIVFPGAAFGEYRWGRPLEEPLQPLATSAWAVRDLVPLGSTGSTRLLDLLERRVHEGRVDAALVELLARSGVRYLVVRNDLDRDRTGGPAPGEVRTAFSSTPELRRVQTFGPRVGAGTPTEHLLPTPTGPLRAIEIYELGVPTARVTTYPIEDAWRVSGGPDGLIALAEQDLLGGRATVLAGDPEGGEAPTAEVWTDGLRRRDVGFGSVRNNFTYALAAGERSPNTRLPPKDRLVLDGESHLALVQQQGDVSLRASSYGSLGRREPEYQPYAALDGDRDTAWVAGSRRFDTRPWIEVRFETPQTLGDDASVVVLLDQLDRPWPTRVVVTTDGGARETVLERTEEPQRVAVPDGSTRRLRVTIRGVGGDLRSLDGPGIRELSLPGLDVERTVAVPADAGARRSHGPPTVLFDRLRTSAYDLVRRDEEGVLRRAFELARPTELAVRATAVPRPGPGLDLLLTAARSQRLRSNASSVWNALPAFRAANAFDDRPATSWVAQPTDAEPTLDLQWDGTRTIDRVELDAAPAPVRAPSVLRIDSPAGTRTVSVTPGRVTTFAPLETDRVRVSFPAPSGVRSGSSPGRVRAAAGLAELRFPALADLLTPSPTLGVELPCGSGPSLEVDGQTIETAVSTDTVRLGELAPVELRVCAESLELDEGRHRVESRPADAFVIGKLALDPATASREPVRDHRAARVERSGAASRRVRVEAGERSYLALGESFTDGWAATYRGRSLEPVRLDGWRQAFVLPAGPAGIVDLRFTPDAWYRGGLLVGLLGALVLLGLAFVPAGNTGPLLSVAAPASRRWPRVVVGALLTLAVLAVAGPVAVAVPALFFLPGRRESLPVLAASFFVLAGVVVLLEPGSPGGLAEAGTFGGAAQVLAGLAFAALAVSLLDSDEPPS